MASRGFITIVMLLLVLLSFGGLIAVGDGWGFVAAAIWPVPLVILKPLFAQFRNVAMQVR